MKEPIKIAKKFFKDHRLEKQTCCICGCDFYDWTGNNPDPVVTDPDAVCCYTCNLYFVIPMRQARVAAGVASRIGDAEQDQADDTGDQDREQGE